MKNACCSPIYVKDRQGNIYPARCGKCIYCLKQDQLDWVFRNMLELEIFGNGIYLTLTYDNEHLNDLNVKEVQLFIKRLRKRYCDVLRVFYVGEYGRKHNRPHYHLLIYGLDFKNLNEAHNVLKKLWNKGFIYVKWIEMGNIYYVCKYLTKIDPRQHDVKPFRKMSLRPPIGKPYFFLHPEIIDYFRRKGYDDVLIFRFRDGKKFRLPRQVKKWIFSDDELRCRSLYHYYQTQKKRLSKSDNDILYDISLKLERQFESDRQKQKLFERFIYE